MKGSQAGSSNKGTPLNPTTVVSIDPSGAGRGNVTPCLTVLHHPDPTRTGERAPLRVLSFGHTALVSRDQPDFAAVGAEGWRPLADAHVSRTPFRVIPEHGGFLVLEGLPPSFRVNGAQVDAQHRVDPRALEQGVVLELGGRILLLLHLSSQRSLTEIATIQGQSDAIDDVRREILRVADVNTSVLVRGETGTGKELVAEAIHGRSGRARAEYVAINMAAIAESVAASTLFGHARGAFTGAQQRHRGFFERASGGTLFLDEIGDTPAAVQPMLLRAIETGRITPLGEECDRRVDLRFVAATDADLEAELAADSFSAALLHRLAGYEIHVPPLRARREDIPLLFRQFLRTESATLNGDVPEGSLSSALMSRLVRHQWPGNVRQLRNFVRQVAIASRGADSLRVPAVAERGLWPAERAAVAQESSVAAEPARRSGDVGEEALLSALRDHEWSPCRAAAALGIPTGTLHGLMRRSPMVRRAADIDDGEIRSAIEACAGDVGAMAARLRVSERGLRMALRQRGLREPADA